MDVRMYSDLCADGQRGYDAGAHDFLYSMTPLAEESYEGWLEHFRTNVKPGESEAYYAGALQGAYDC